MEREIALTYAARIRALRPEWTVSNGGSSPQANVWISQTGQLGDPIFLKTPKACEWYIARLQFIDKGRNELQERGRRS